MRREVLDQLPLSQTGILNQCRDRSVPTFMGFRVKEVPISWDQPAHLIWACHHSSWRWQVGGGYWHVLRHLCIETRFGTRLLPPRELSAHE